ncbi:hypothetical protein AGLY_006792 [Aphis glycines]|uniref:Uncharacterized protein n=1 Tax=Aphis glycines TaxID=307491 RepID=A0A6G0TR61_APHGL|nr:hypothetical protein AGLY_006792 [Aphis glycines]
MYEPKIIDKPANQIDKNVSIADSIFYQYDAEKDNKLNEVGVHVAIILVIPNHVYYFVSFMIFINLLLLLVDYGLQDHPCKQICRHLSLSSAASFHCVFGSTALTSFLIRSSHRKRGLPNGLFPVGFSLITALMKEPSFLQACPAHINLLLLISDIISDCGTLPILFLIKKEINVKLIIEKNNKFLIINEYKNKFMNKEEENSYSENESNSSEEETDKTNTTETQVEQNISKRKIKKINLKAINDKIVTTIGKIIIILLLNNNKIKTEFHVVDKEFPIPRDGILGHHFLLQNNAIIDKQELIQEQRIELNVIKESDL